MNDECCRFIKESCHQLISSNNCLRRLQIPDKVFKYLEKLETDITHQQENSALITIVIVGEFNAGKSTFINAILEREVAYVDPFEATTSIAVISPGSREEVIYRDAQGHDIHLTIDEYLQKCAKNVLGDVCRFDITLNYKLPAVIVDTPGMGSITSVHEERAETAIIDDADLVIWMMDSSDMLSAKDCAFLKRSREVNLPIWCALSKIDSLDQSDIDECISVIHQATGINTDDIIGLSALRYIENHEDAGVSCILSKIRSAAQQAQHIKKAAEAAKETEILDEFFRVVRLIDEQLRAEEIWIANEALVLQEESNIVISSVEDDVCIFVKTEAISYTGEHSAQLSASSGDTRDVMVKMCNSFLHNRLPALTETIVTMIHRKAMDTWKAQFEGRQKDLSVQITHLLEENTVDNETMTYLQQQLNVVTERHNAVKYSFGIVPALIGATILHVIAEPISGTANLLATISGWYAGSSIGKQIEAASGQQYTSQTHQMDRMNVAQCLAEITVDKCLSPAIHSYIDKLALQALNKRCEQHLPGVTYESMKATRSIVNSIVSGTDSIRRSGSLHPNLPVAK